MRLDRLRLAQPARCAQSGFGGSGSTESQGCAAAYSYFVAIASIHLIRAMLTDSVPPLAVNAM
jgi:hypothetical protein